MLTHNAHQTCPYCGHIVDDSHAEWEEGETEVDCDYCKRTYSVVTHYKFQGFETRKICSTCNEIEEECYCESEESA